MQDLLKVKCVISGPLVPQNKIVKIRTAFKQVSRTLFLSEVHEVQPQTLAIGWMRKQIVCAMFQYTDEMFTVFTYS